MRVRCASVCLHCHGVVPDACMTTLSRCAPAAAALVSVVNTKFPELGELLLHRLALQFMRAYKRNDKPVCTAAAKFLGQLINQGVAHEVCVV